MSKKELKMNRFGESIRCEIESFNFAVKRIKQKYPPNPENNPDVFRLYFKWKWNGYNGYGEIDFFKSTSSLCNIFGENESSMTVNSESKRQQINGRNNSALYNDSSLVEIFNLILSKTNLAQVSNYSF